MATGVVSRVIDELSVEVAADALRREGIEVAVVSCDRGHNGPPATKPSQEACIQYRQADAKRVDRLLQQLL